MRLSDKPIRRVAVCGLGKLGACLAATLAARKFQVVGCDIDRAKVAALKNGRAPMDEPGLQQEINKGRSGLTATTNVHEAVAASDACCFVIPTPSLPDGSFDNSYLVQAVRSVAESARALNKSRYLFILNSTVTPGSCDHVYRPLLEEVLRGRCGHDFGLCYNPEFIALGNVVRGLLQPDFVLLGESDARSGKQVERLYRKYCLGNPPIERMPNISAEIAKISVNCAVTMKISFVNQLSAVCAKIPGADAAVILQAIGNDRRIGTEYLRPGLGYGGPCFPRDNRLFQYVARSVGAEASLAEATDRINENVNRRLLETVLYHAPHGEPVAVFGLAYKPFTAVTDWSPGVWLMEQLAQRNHTVLAHDYAVAPEAVRGLNSNATRIHTDPTKIFRQSCRVFAITCPWPGYKNLFRTQKAELRPGTTIIDPWNILGAIGLRMENVAHLTSLV